MVSHFCHFVKVRHSCKQLTFCPKLQYNRNMARKNKIDKIQFEIGASGSTVPSKVASSNKMGNSPIQKDCKLVLPGLFEPSTMLSSEM